jgi:protein-S-isoprenylcysteine O-methyltransferase Ste14
VPVTLDGTPTMHWLGAVAIDIGLLLLFALQHSVMARPGFKKWFTRYIPVPAERSAYVLATCAVLVLIFAFWQPIGGVIWDVQQPVARGLLYGLYAWGWIIVFVTTHMINHFDLFGLRQVWLFLRKKPYTHLNFATPGPYSVIRHPLYLGWTIAFWATPTMTISHLLLAVVWTAYMLVAIQFEERDLVAHHGQSYADYRKRVPMVVPRLPRRREAATVEPITNLPTHA